MATSQFYSLPRLGSGPILKEGCLEKRQRRKTKPQDYTGKFAFQQRYFYLTGSTLWYFPKETKKFLTEMKGDPEKQFPVQNIQIVETVPYESFKKDFCFQAGNEDEVMYFKADCEESRKSWMKALRDVAKGDAMLPMYHPGVFGQQMKWSCCGGTRRNAGGCKRTTKGVHMHSRRYSQILIPPQRRSKKRRNRAGTDDSGIGSTRISNTVQLNITEGDWQTDAPLKETRPQEPYTSGKSYNGHLTTPVTSLAYKAAATVIAGNDDGQVAVIDTTNDEVKVFEAGSNVAHAKFARWKNYLAIGSTDVCLKDMNDWEKSVQLTQPTEYTQDSKNTSKLVVFSPNGDLILVDVEDNKITTWNDPQLPDIKTENTDFLQGCVHCVAISPDPRKPQLAIILTVEQSKKILLFDYEAQEAVGSIELPEAEDDCECSVYSTYSNYAQALVVACGGTMLICDIENQECVLEYPLKEPGVVITGLCYSYTGTHLAVSLSNGMIEIFDGNRPIIIENRLQLFTLPEIGPDVHATSMAYSQDNSHLAVGYNHGGIQLWKVPFEIDDFQTELECNELQLTFDIEGAKYKSEDNGYTIEVPKGAIEEGSMSISHTVVPIESSRHFELPDGAYPVSAIVSICPSDGTRGKLRKPIAITLQHCMDYASLVENDGLQDIAFFKAHHDDAEMSDTCDKKIYKFHPVKSGMVKHNAQYSTLYTNHFCYWCIGKYRREKTDAANYLIIEAFPKANNDPSFKIDYCIAYDLKTCFKNVRDQYPTADYELTKKVVRFSTTENPAVQVKHREHIGEGWTLKRISSQSSISPSDINFWDMGPSLVHRCKEKQYPPRFSLEAKRGEQWKEADFEVSFEGVTSESDGTTPCFKVQLSSLGLKALRHCHTFLTESDGYDPMRLASRLFRNDVIEHHHCLDEIMRFGNIYHQKVKMLRYVMDAVEKEPRKFNTVCKTIRELFPDGAKHLEDEYGRLMSPTQNTFEIDDEAGMTETSSEASDGTHHTSDQPPSITVSDYNSVPIHFTSQLGDITEHDSG